MVFPALFRIHQMSLKPNFQHIIKAEIILNTFKGSVFMFSKCTNIWVVFELPWSVWVGGRSDHLLAKHSLERLCKHHHENALSYSSICKQTSARDRGQIIYTCVSPRMIFLSCAQHRHDNILLPRQPEVNASCVERGLCAGAYIKTSPRGGDVSYTGFMHRCFSSCHTPVALFMY